MDSLKPSDTIGSMTKPQPPRAAFIQALKNNTSVLFQAWWCKEWTRRDIVKVRSQDVIIGHPNKTREDGTPVPCYLGFPKATEITQPEPGHFVVTCPSDETGHFNLSYKFGGE